MCKEIRVKAESQQKQWIHTSELKDKTVQVTVHDFITGEYVYSILSTSSL